MTTPNLLATIASHEADLSAREQAIAHAMELLTIDHATQQAYACGVTTERHRILTLISHQLDTLNGAGMNSLSLGRLAETITGGPA